MNRLLSWLGENFIPAWKAVSILFTGGFGILGLLKNFKEKLRDEETDVIVERITRWGWISLTGIVISTVFGITAQVKETHDSTAKALDLISRSDITLHEIQRILSPLQDPTIQGGLVLECDRQSPACDGLSRGAKSSGVRLTLFFFSSVKDAHEYLSQKGPGPRLTYVAEQSHIETAEFGSYFPERRELQYLNVFFSSTNLNRGYSDGTFKSTLDLQGATLLMWIQVYSRSGYLFAKAYLVDLTLTAKGVVVVHIKHPSEKVVDFQQNPIHVFEFPDKITSTQ